MILLLVVSIVNDNHHWPANQAIILAEQGNPESPNNQASNQATKQADSTH